MNPVRIKYYADYLLRAKNRHGIHSPFVYELLDKVIYNNEPVPDEESIENYFKILRNNHNTIRINDMGAGSSITRSKKRTISDISINSGKNIKYRRLFHHLAAHFKPTTMIELGTSFGMSTIYFAKGNPEVKVHTIEGCAESAKIAKENFRLFTLNINLHIGTFDDHLPGILENMEQLDFVFMDGNHREEPTKKYFEMFLDKIHDNSVLIIDDIYWSKGMKRAWDYIKMHPRVKVTLDLFETGIVFFKDGLTKQDFVIKF